MEYDGENNCLLCKKDYEMKDNKCKEIQEEYFFWKYKTINKFFEIINT